LEEFLEKIIQKFLGILGFAIEDRKLSIIVLIDQIEDFLADMPLITFF